MSFFGQAWEFASDTLGETLSGILESILNATVYRLLYYIARGLCRIVQFLDQMFRVFAGIDKVTYNGEQDYLINVFFRNNAVSNVYWGMALIGIVMCMGFAIAAVIRKMFDSSGKVQQSLGQTLTSLAQSIVLILGLSAIMVVVLNSTNVLMQQVNYIFNDAENLDIPITIEYTDEQYAAMGRVLNTIGNYSLNPSHTNRYNINSCFNEIRGDLYNLEQQGVFRYYYKQTDANGRPIHTWQSVLQDVANAGDLRSDLLMDKSYESVTKALLDAMDIIKKDNSLKPLPSFTRTTPSENMVPLDRLVFLMGTTHAAANPAYNDNPTMDDSVRGPYYKGEKSIYSLDNVNADFDIGVSTMDYLIIFVAAIAMIFDLIVIILNCVARIFNLMFLYIIAPPVLAARPLDNGGKTKQWMTAFLVQSLSVFGTVIAMRLLLIFLPIITSDKLVLFPNNSLLNLMGKLVLIYGGFEAAKKSTSMLTGILADSAGWQSIQAGDMSANARGLIGRATGLAGKAVGTAAGVAGSVAGFAFKPVTNLAKRPFAAIGKFWSELGTGKSESNQAEKYAKQQYANEKALEKLKSEKAAEEQEKQGPKPSPPKQPLDPIPVPDGGLYRPGEEPPHADPPPLPQRFHDEPNVNVNRPHLNDGDGQNNQGGPNGQDGQNGQGRGNQPLPHRAQEEPDLRHRRLEGVNVAPVGQYDLHRQDNDRNAPDGQPRQNPPGGGQVNPPPQAANRRRAGSVAGGNQGQVENNNQAGHQPGNGLPRRELGNQNNNNNQ